MMNGCALNAHGSLKNASDIEFFESETDTHPISGPGHANVGNKDELGQVLCFFLFNSHC